MTKLTYIVGGEEIWSYSKAVQRSQELGVPMIRRYTPIDERAILKAEAKEAKVRD